MLLVSAAGGAFSGAGGVPGGVDGAVVRSVPAPSVLVPPVLALAPAESGESLRAARGTRTLAEARKLLSEGDRDAARTRALTALAFNPYETEGYELLLDLARTNEISDEQVKWAKWLYWAHSYNGREDEAAAAAARLDALYDGWRADEEILAAWREGVEGAIDRAASSKQFLLAGHLLGKLIDLNPASEDLSKQYEKLFEKAGEALSGGAFTAERVRRKSPGWIARQNQKHEPWEDAFERNTDHYKVITNISYEFFETVSVVMEDMFDFYQDTYDFKKRAPKVTLAIHRRRSDFDRFCQDELGGSLGLGTGGWFYDKEMTVAAYDRTESGQDLTDLYRVLFHEASHQFMYLLTKKKTKQDPPTWLNEGTASYFEGCELKADGSIVKNKPALGRIREWESIEKGDQRHSLKEVVTCPHREYDGSFYSYGWALVYFLNNYEGEDGNLVYRDAYLEYLSSYTKKGPKDSDEAEQEAYDRAVEYFIEDVDDPAVQDWGAFEERWRTYTQGIVKESKAGPEFADELQKRCRRYLERGDHGRALIAAEQADDRRPGDGATYLLLATASDGVGRTEDAVYWMLRHWERAWTSGDAEAVASAEEWLTKNGAKDVVAGFCVNTRDTYTAIEKAMQTAQADGSPVSAMLFGVHAMQAFGLEREDLIARIAKMGEDSGVDLRLWQRGYVKDPSANRQWGGQDVVRYDSDGVLINNPEEYGRPTEICDYPTLAWVAPPFEVRGSVQVDGEMGGYLYFGIGTNGRPQAAVRFLPDARVDLEKVDASFDEDGLTVMMHSHLSTLKFTPRKIYPFHVAVTGGGGTLRIGDEEDVKLKLSLPEDFSAERVTGRIGLSAGDDSLALYRDVEIRTDRPFWPVAPREEE